jgi:hypothetical protein
MLLAVKISAQVSALSFSKPWFERIEQKTSFILLAGIRTVSVIVGN